MQITARFDSKCSKCGDQINAGNKIEWERGSKGVHINCPEKEKNESDSETIKVSGGEGYGCPGWTKDEVFYSKQHEKWLFVLKASSKYLREDGLSFGVGDDSGYIYYADCREATDEESRPLLEQLNRQRDRNNLKQRVQEIAKIIQNDGECPEGSNNPIGERIFDTQDIYGGGNWFVIDKNTNIVWYVNNNGMDGDNWDRNNVRTGGAGAMGWKMNSEKLVNELISINNKLN